MTVDIDKHAGFCSGVEKAIRRVERELKKGEPIYCLGDIVHNEVEVDRLKSKGMVIVNRNQFRKLKNASVLFRAHGEPPEIYEIAKKNNIRVIDATCPVILNLQGKIRSDYEEVKQRDGQVVLFGKKDHPEIISLVGQIEGAAIVVEQPGDLDRIDFSKPVYFYSQTTKREKVYKEFQDEIRKRMVQCQGMENIDFHSFDTICGQVLNREPGLREFARAYDVIVFVSDRASSNGTMLCGICMEENPNTHFISRMDELAPEWFLNAESIGISGATSTPGWILKDVASSIEKIRSKTAPHCNK